MQQRSRNLAGLVAAGDQRQLAGGPPFPGVSRPHCLEASPPGHDKIAILLAWMVAGRQNARICGQRNDEFDIYTIPADGGEETRLTTAKGLDDGPEYSPDGKYIYFNSERSGHMQIWRMKSDGSEQEQVLADEFNNWFPHISPDGEWMVFVAYEQSVSGHPENKDVMLRMMSLTDKKITTLAKLFGGQGTINVPSWSPDVSR